MTKTELPSRQEPEGFLLVDKPQGPTSHDVVATARRLLNTRKVGHGGTLDPMATGVLVLGVGRATKLLTYVSGSTKQYEATIRLGQATNTDDAMGEVVEARGAALGGTDLQLESVTEEMGHLTGDITQVPSAVSAIKVRGKRAYDLVRKGETVRLKGRPVTVSKFDLVGVSEKVVEANGEELPVVDLDVVTDVSSGTYIRALARDLGEALGVGGHLTSLRRTSVGNFKVGECTELSTLETMRENSDPLPLLSLSDAARKMLPVAHIEDPAARQRFRHGGAPKPSEVEILTDGVERAAGGEPNLQAEPEVHAEGEVGSVYAVTGADGEVLGLVRRTVVAGEPECKTLNVFVAG